MDSAIELVSIVSQSGTPSASGELEIEETVTFNSITLDTNQTADISQELIITANDGVATRPTLTAIHGTTPNNTQSTYTITDYDNMQVGVITSTSAETLNSVLTRISLAVNLNVETPIDFK